MRKLSRKQFLQSKYCPPPSGFRPAGEVDFALFSLDPPLFMKTSTVKGRRADGIRYETKAQEKVLQSRADTYASSPWFRFRSKGCARFYYCQPDGLDFDINRGLITIVEFKLQHTSNAWWQTRKLYEPVVKYVFGDIWEYAVIEIVKWYDPHTSFPENIRLTPDLSFKNILPGKFHLHIWNGRD